MAIALAERFALDVRVGYLSTLCSRVGFAGHDPVGVGTAQPLPVQMDLERTQLDVVQHDAIGGYHQFMFFQVDLDFVRTPLGGP